MPYKFYEIATLSFDLMEKPKVSSAAHTWAQGPDAKGDLLGSWAPDIGTLGRLLILRGFASAEELAQERNRALHSTNPFNAAGLLTAFDMCSYAPFPFLPPVKPRAYGKVYEIRTYLQEPGGLPATLKGWEEAIGPAEEYTAHLVTALQALDGQPRITHIWGFASFEERVDLRKQHYAAGLWPPKGGPENIREATSMIAFPEEYSPLC